MDRVRFGRALGVGAREAAKALVKAADAAAAPNPPARNAPAATPPRQAQPHATAAGPAGQAPASQRPTSARATVAGVKRGSKRFGEAVWGPFVKLSGVLWLELTGVFFGLFALSFGIAVWKLRADFRGAPDAQHRAWLLLAALLIFAYFTVSSFLRARRRGRR